MAIELARPLTLLTELLPDHEQGGLTRTLQMAMVDLPTAIALDIMENTARRRGVYVRIDVALELIDQIYPALDTADARDGFERLMAHTESGNLRMVVPPPQPVYVDEEEEESNV